MILTVFVSVSQLVIRVEDVNDNSPVFELAIYQAYDVAEDTVVGSVLLTVTASDGDFGANAELRYHVTDDNFCVDNEGVITVCKILDADHNNGFYRFSVVARDNGTPTTREGSSTVYVYTSNANDEKPVFTQQVYTPNVKENAANNTLVTTVSASDADGDNVRFSFSGSYLSSGQFAIDENTGEIRLMRGVEGALDLDKDRYELHVTAHDDGSCCSRWSSSSVLHTATALVVVFVYTDVVDKYPPVFADCSSYRPSVTEEVVTVSRGAALPVITVKATNNGGVKYAIVDTVVTPPYLLSVDTETGVVSLYGVIDKEGGGDNEGETGGSYAYVSVKATDPQGVEGVCSFPVEISDVNDNAPVFDEEVRWIPTALVYAN